MTKIVSDPKNVNFYHGISRDNHRFTIALFSKKGRTVAIVGKPTIKIIASAAICSNKDAFKKSFGRQVAQTRLFQGKKVNSFKVDTHRQFHELLNSKTVAELTDLFSLEHKK